MYRCDCYVVQDVSLIIADSISTNDRIRKYGALSTVQSTQLAKTHTQAVGLLQQSLAMAAGVWIA